MTASPVHVGDYSPAQAIAVARTLVRQRFYELTPGAVCQLAELLNSIGSAGQDEAHAALEAIVNELETSHYCPPRNPEPVPGIPFIWVSKYFGRELYFKFKLVGSRKKPRMVIFSCHPPDFSKDFD